MLTNGERARVLRSSAIPVVIVAKVEPPSIVLPVATSEAMTEVVDVALPATSARHSASLRVRVSVFSFPCVKCFSIG